MQSIKRIWKKIWTGKKKTQGETKCLVCHLAQKDSDGGILMDKQFVFAETHLQGSSGYEDHRLAQS